MLVAVSTVFILTLYFPIRWSQAPWAPRRCMSIKVFILTTPLWCYWVMIRCTMRDTSLFFASHILKLIIASTLPPGERFVFRDVNDHHLGWDLLSACPLSSTSPSIFAFLQSPWPGKEDRVSAASEETLVVSRVQSYTVFFVKALAALQTLGFTKNHLIYIGWPINTTCDPSRNATIKHQSYN